MSGMPDRNDFENDLLGLEGLPDWKGALIEVCDTAYICKRWLEAYAPGYTPADIVALTALVIAREQRLCCRPGRRG